MKDINSINARILDRLSLYLNLMPDAVTKEQLFEFAGQNASAEQLEYAFGCLLSSYCALDTDDDADMRIFRDCFTKIPRLLDVSEYKNDEYFKLIEFPERKLGAWEFRKQKFKPCEAFLYDETQVCPDGLLKPCIGFFTEEFEYPAVLQNGREWITVTPHEINTTKPALDACFGNVLTYGLGFGYFTLLASLKKNVNSVTVVELDADAVSLFKEYILPQFPDKDKVRIVNEDAFEFAADKNKSSGFDFVFADIWHDPSDGVEMYEKFKILENRGFGTRYCYWVEKTLKWYIAHNTQNDLSCAPDANFEIFGTR